MLLDIRPDYLQIVRDILQKHVPQYEVWAFGSRAKWTAKEYSDLDLCVVSDKPLSFAALGAMGEDFSESDLPWKVDVVEWATTSPSFRKIIEQDKVVVQNRGKNWESVTLGDILTLQRGMDLPVQDRKTGRVPIIASNGITGCHNQAPVKAPGVVIGRSGSIGGGQYIECDFWPLNTTLWVKDFKGNDPRYCYYLLRSIDFSGMNAGSGVPTLNRNHLHPMPMLRPPVTAQKQISSVLGALDDRIALLRETNATLEAIAQALFKSWFVNFDPVRAKAEGLEPEGIPPEIAALFPSEFEDSVLGEIPKGWSVGTLANLTTLNSESWTAKKHPATVAYIDLANAKDNEIAAVTNYSFDDAPSRARRVLRNGDTIVGTVRPGNRSFAFIHEPVENLTASTGFAVLRPIAFENTEFVYLAATQESSIEHLAHVADGGAYPAVRPEVVAGLACVLASKKVMQVFHELTAPFLAGIAKNQGQTEYLAALRDTLLPQLMTGKLNVQVDKNRVEVFSA